MKINGKLGFLIVIAMSISSIQADNKNQSWFGGWGKTIAAWTTVFAGAGIGSWYWFIQRPQMQENRLITARRTHLIKARQNPQLSSAMDEKISNIDKGLAENPKEMTRAQYAQWLKKREEAGKL